MDHFQEEFQDFFVAMRQYSDSMYTLYRTKSEYLDTSFFPARSKDLDILHLPIEYITRKRMACYISQCDAALARVGRLPHALGLFFCVAWLCLSFLSPPLPMPLERS